jgi:hypothetical protein
MIADLHEHIQQAAEFGSNRTIIRIAARNINVIKTIKALKDKLRYTLGEQDVRVVWYKTTYGLIIMVAGSLAVSSVAQLHFMKGAIGEASILFAGSGSRVFSKIATSAMKDHEQCLHSFASSR